MRARYGKIIAIAIAGIFGLLVWVANNFTWVYEAPKTRVGTQPKACLLSEGAKRGQLWAGTCKGCHDIGPVESDLRHSSGGPNLQEVYMSLAGTRPVVENPTARPQPYPPLAAARDAGIIWTEENLLHYLQNPKDFLTKATGKAFTTDAFYMQFYIGDENARRDVIQYLKAIKDHPECD